MKSVIQGLLLEQSLTLLMMIFVQMIAIVMVSVERLNVQILPDQLGIVYLVLILQIGIMDIVILLLIILVLQVVLNLQLGLLRINGQLIVYHHQVVQLIVVLIQNTRNVSLVE